MAELVTLKVVFVADKGTGESLDKRDEWEHVLHVLRVAYANNKVLSDRVIDVIPNY
jgi:hypothetical protein